MAQAHGSVAAGRPLRSDAERNRRRILEVALDVFAERGLEAGFDEIAHRAGVGVGTVYRRFPQRDDLVRALFESRLAELTEFAERAAAGPDAWAALRACLERIAEVHTRDRGLRELMAQSVRGPETMREQVGHLHVVLEQLVTRARGEGRLRADVVVPDLVVLAGMLSAVSSTATPDLWRRYAAVLLDGLRADRGAGEPLPHHPPGEDEIDEVLGSICGRPAPRQV